MSIDFGPLRLHGVSVIGLPPLGVVHIPLSSTPKVIYGRNGVGKTRLLRAVACGLSGQRPSQGRVFLHATIASDESTNSHWHGILPAILEGLRQEHNANAERPDDVDDPVDGWWDVTDSYLSWTLIQLVRAHVEARRRRMNQPGLDTLASRLDSSAYQAALAHGKWQIVIDDEVRAAVAAGDAPQLELGGVSAYDFSGAVIWDDPGMQVPGDERIVLEPIGDDAARWAIWYGVESIGDGVFAADFRQRIAEASSDSELRTPGLWAAEDKYGMWSGAEDDYALEPSTVAAQGPDAMDTWPAWASIPVLRLGTTDGLASGDWFGKLDVVNVGETGDRDVDDFTRKLLAARQGRLVELADNDEVVLGAERIQAIGALEKEASALFQRIAAAAPPLTFKVGTPKDWFAGELPTWRAGDVPLSDLASSWQRWARVSIDLATRQFLQNEAEEEGDHADWIRERRENGLLVSPAVLIVDEPELGLHRSAVDAVGELLRDFSQTGTAFAATHAPQLLNARGVEALHLQFDSATGKSRLHVPQLADIHSDATMSLLAEELGVTRADLFQLVRVFVCVEGQHDLVVLANLLGGALSASFARLLPMDGAKKLNEALTVPMIFDYTDANVVVVLDNSPDVEKDWNDLVDAHQRGDKKRSQSIIRAINERPGGEAGWIAKFAQAAIDRGRLDRVTVFGLSRPDVICYLPPVALGLPPNRTWDELVSEWRKSSARPADIKGWLRSTHGVRVSLATIERAAEDAAMQTAFSDGAEMDADLDDLALTIRAASRRF